MSGKILKSKYRKQISWYLLIASILPVLVLGVYSYFAYVSGLTSRVNVATNASLHQVQVSVDNIEESIRKNYLEIVESDEVKWLVENDIRYKDYQELKEATNKISGPIYLSEYISQYTFVNMETNWVLSNYGMAPFNVIANKGDFTDFFFNNDEARRIFWLNNIGNKKEIYIDKRTAINLDDLSLILKLPLVGEKYSSMLIVSLHKDNFDKLMRNSIGNGNITVLDNKGKLIYTDSNNKLIEEYCEENFEYVKTLSSSKGIRLGDDSSYNFLSKVSPVSGWTFVASYNMSLVNEGAAGILAVMIFLVIIVLMIIIIIRLGTRRIYEPVLNLARHMGNTIQADSNIPIGDEFDYIETEIDSLVDSKFTLENLVNKQKGQLSELFMLRLMRGDLTKDAIDQRVKTLAVNLKENYCVVTAICRYQSKNDDEEGTEQDIVRMNVVENMPKEIRQKLLFPVMDNARSIIMVLCNDELEELEKDIFEIHKILTSFVRNEYDYTIHTGVSRPFSALDKFRIAYNESVEALKNVSSNEGEEVELENVSFYSDVALPKKNDYIYEYNLERRLKEAVDNCNTEEAFEILDEFLEDINSKSVANNERYLHLHRIMISIILVATTAGLSVESIFDNNNYNIFLQFNQIYDGEKLKSFFRYHIITPIIKQLTEFRKSNSEVIFEKIKKIINDAKGDITLAECADMIGYHSSYIWKIMKTKIDMSFTDYLAIEKMRIAKEMLLETNLTVAEIASQLNYTNTQNFIRFFSKNENTTPGKYRKSYKRE